MRITSARITPLPRPMPQGMFDKMPEVHVKTDDGREHYLFQYYPDEISFTEKEFIEKIQNIIIELFKYFLISLKYYILI